MEIWRLRNLKIPPFTCLSNGSAIELNSCCNGVHPKLHTIGEHPYPGSLKPHQLFPLGKSPGLRSIFITPELLVRIEQNQRHSIGNEKVGMESANKKIHR